MSANQTQKPLIYQSIVGNNNKIGSFKPNNAFNIQKATRKEVFDEINAEREVQDKLCNLQPSLAAEYLAIEECMAEARKKWSRSYDDEYLRLAMIKIASLAVRGVENHGLPKSNSD